MQDTKKGTGKGEMMKKKDDYEELERKFSGIENQNDIIRQRNTELMEQLEEVKQKYDELLKEFLKCQQIIWSR